MKPKLPYVRGFDGLFVPLLCSRVALFLLLPPLLEPRHEHLAAVTLIQVLQVIELQVLAKAKVNNTESETETQKPTKYKILTINMTS